MLMVADVEGALKRASYEKLLEMFEAVSARYYLADDPAFREEVGKLVIAVAAEAHKRGRTTCNIDLPLRDDLAREAVARNKASRRAA